MLVFVVVETMRWMRIINFRFYECDREDGTRVIEGIAQRSVERVPVNSISDDVQWGSNTFTCSTHVEPLYTPRPER